jgi:2-methylcitrate dehydratase PrpD
MAFSSVAEESTASDLSVVLAKHVVNCGFEQLPTSMVNVTKKSLLDALAVTLAASGLGEVSRPFVELAREQAGLPECSVIGHGFKAPAAMAVMANGAMAHELDFEDTHDGAMVHPNAAVVPAALAIAERDSAISGKDLLTAIAIGSDLACRLSLAFRRDPEEFGWYFRPMLGAFGATAAAARLMHLTEQETIQAFALVLCQVTCSAELKRSPHSHLRAVRDAFTAKAGYLSAVMAQKGVNAFDHPLEGASGLYQLYSQTEYDEQVVLSGLGSHFESSNVSFKPWPSCRGTHSFIEAALKLKANHGVRSEDIASVTAIGSGFFEVLAKPLSQKRRPATATDAKFSVPFTVAVALTKEDVRLSDFDSAGLADRDVLSLADRITYEVDKSIGMRELGRGALQLATVDGRRLTERVDEPLGAPSNPLSSSHFVTKFRECANHAARALSASTVDKAIDSIMNLEEQKIAATILCGL